MFQLLVLNAALSIGQAPMPITPAAQTAPAVRAMPSVGGPEILRVAPTAEEKKPTDSKAAPIVVHDAGCCDKRDCNVIWLKPWKCEDLENKPAEKKECGCKSFLHCPKEEKKEEEKKEGEEPAAAEDTDGPLMQLLKCRNPDRCPNAPKIYGWVQAGYTANVDSPNDRINFGTNFNWRSNDIRLNQVYFVVEKALEQKEEFNIGYRVDFYTGHNTPFQVANGLLSDFTGFDATSGYGVEGPSSFRQLNRIGIDLPQFYVNAHLPILTEKGVDILVGKFWTPLGHEVYYAPQMEFYSMSYEIIYATPFTHTGVQGTVHATDTLDITAAVVQGSDVFRDNNSSPSYMCGMTWNSCDKRFNWTTSAISGPEQFNNNSNYRSVITSYVTGLFGCRNEWKFILGGNYGYEENAVANAAGGTNNAEWYGLSSYAFYTVNPKLILGARGEWFRDDDGARTAVTKRPGFGGNFYELTLGATYKPYKNLRLRPELRFDWFDGQAADGSTAQPFNDLRKNTQTTAAIDFVWEF